MTQRRMSQSSRKSFLRANNADIYGHGNAWLILLSWKSSILFQKSETWSVRGGDDVPVVYSSPQSAAQAIQRVRPDMKWTVHEMRPEQDLHLSHHDHSTASEEVQLMQKDGAAVTKLTNKDFENWLIETTVDAQVAGRLDQLSNSGGDIGSFIERFEKLRLDLKK